MNDSKKCVGNDRKFCIEIDWVTKNIEYAAVARSHRQQIHKILNYMLYIYISLNLQMLKLKPDEIRSKCCWCCCCFSSSLGRFVYCFQVWMSLSIFIYICTIWYIQTRKKNEMKRKKHVFRAGFITIHR